MEEGRQERAAVVRYEESEFSRVLGFVGTCAGSRMRQGGGEVRVRVCATLAHRRLYSVVYRGSICAHMLL